MNLLIQTSKTLYDKDIQDKTNEIIKLKDMYESPKIYFSSGKDWNNKKLETFENIKNNIAKIVSRNYSYIVKNGLFGSPRTDISIQIEKYLNILTKNNCTTWCYNISNEIIGNLSDVFDTFISCKIWNNLTNQLNERSLFDLIYTFVIERLEDALSYIYLVDCTVCKKTSDYSSEEGLCYECEFPHEF